jgi:hypothetical protein
MSVRDVVQAAAGVGGGGEYVEDVFSTYLYTGNDSTQTITNGIDLDSEGGMVWVKSRDQAGNPTIIDTDRGVNKNLPTNQTYAEDSDPSISSFNSNGFSINSIYGFINDTGINYASWTFRKSPNFFDVVTYTGDGSVARSINHNLGSTPGCVMIKATSRDGSWIVGHRSLGSWTAGQPNYLLLDSTASVASSSSFWGSGSANPTDTTFNVGSSTAVNQSGQTYAAYLFAHDAGGFGLSGEDNVISCGSYTGGGGVDTVTLGYEPQWILMKNATGSSNWRLMDTMRGMSYTNLNFLDPNTSNAEGGFAIGFVKPTPTGFTVEPGFFGTGATVIYIAIRRPMKTPESGTEVFNADTRGSATATANNTSYYSGFPVDLAIGRNRFYAGGDTDAYTRLQGANKLFTDLTNAETTVANYFDSNKGFWGTTQSANTAQLYWMFKRAPSVFDVVCYTGSDVNRTVAHNLTVVPELMIVKYRNDGLGSDYGFPWIVYHSALGAGFYLRLNQTNSSTANDGQWNGSPTASVINIGSSGYTNYLGLTFVAYLFASCPGVSKVSSYTGTGADLNVDCGFSAGARFVLIKRTDSTGDWYVWDSARGIVSGNDPYLLLNSTAAEVTSTDYIDPLASGFTVTSSAPAALNASGGSYIFLAIA